MSLINIKKLNEDLDAVLNEDFAIYNTTANGFVDIEFPDGTILNSVPATFFTKSREDGYSYDSNIYGVDTQYAVGGYTGGSEEYEEEFNLDSLDEIDFDTFLQDNSNVDNIEDIQAFIADNNYKVINITIDDETINRDFYEFEPEEPDYE